MGLALILTFSPWEKEQQGARWDYRRCWRGRQSDPVKPSEPARPHPVPLARERELTAAAPVDLGNLRWRLIKVPGNGWDAWGQ